MNKANILLLSTLTGLSGTVMAQEAVKLTVLHTNDHHGRFWKDSKDQYGMSARKTLIDSIRNEVSEKGGELLLLSGGDINTGVPESDMQFAKPDFLGMKTLRYDAMAVGNHEFDVPFGVLQMQQVWSQVPFLSSNIYDTNTKKRIFAPYKIFHRKNLKIAVIGLTTTDTLKVGSSSLKSKYEMTDPTTEVMKIANSLEETKPDVVIGLTHMGHYYRGLHGSNAYGDVTLAKKLPKGTLDMIIGGHSQNIVCFDTNNEKRKNFKPGDACIPNQINGTWIMQAQEWGKYVGRADFTIRDAEVTLDSYRLIPVNLKTKVVVGNEKKYVSIEKEIVEDQQTKKLLRPFYDKGHKLINYKVGTTSVRLDGDRKDVRSNQTNLGRMIADSMMLKTNADLSIMNSGGVRDSIAIGEVRYRDILKVLPWGNSIVTVTLTGTELKTYLDEVLSKTPGSGGYVQRSTNFEWSSNKITINGDEIDPIKVYKLALPGYASRGGDNYPPLNKHPNYVDTGYIDADVLREYIAKLP
jgi:5'-nucleotidase/UDP-sugar diphosphatase